MICIGTWDLWRERVICNASNVVPAPDGISDEAAATCYQNPLTAWALTQSIQKLSEGRWLLQTAAASSVGRLVLQLSKVYGFRTINVIHRRAQAEIIRALGGGEIICTEHSVGAIPGSNHNVRRRLVGGQQDLDQFVRHRTLNE